MTARRLNGSLSDTQLARAQHLEQGFSPAVQ